MSKIGKAFRSERCGFFLSLVVLVLCLVFSSKTDWAQSNQHNAQARNSDSTAGNASLVSRGRYIVEDVAVCSQCHTAHDENGQLDHNHWLGGGALWLVPANGMKEDWPLKVPRIAGNPPATDEEMVTLLTTGIWRDGHYLRAPMPQFRMSREDAQAVVAYLKSLPGTR
jgi:mono/diheme cytochrome c family protein